MTAIPSNQTFSDDYFISTGIYCVFTPTGGNSNVLAGWKIRDITRGSVTVDQEEVTHQLAGNAFKQFISLGSDPGDVTLASYFEPKKPKPTEARLKTMKSGQDGVLQLIMVEYAPGSETGTAYCFFSCGANFQEYGDFSAPINKPATCNFKFKLTGEPLYGSEAEAVATSV